MVAPGRESSRARSRWTTGLGFCAELSTRPLPEPFLLQQVLINFISIGQVVSNGSVHLLQAQSGIELLDGFRAVPLLKGNDNGVERDAQRTHPERTLAVLHHVPLR